MKIAHKLFPKEWLKEQLTGKPAGSRLVLECNTYDVPLLAIGYNYDEETTHYFIMTRRVGSTANLKDDPYKLKFRDKFFNTLSRPMGQL